MENKIEQQQTPHPFAFSRKQCVLLLLGLAFVLRVLMLGHAKLWQDEILFINTASPTLSVMDVIKNYWQLVVSMAWMPLAAVIENIYCHIIGFVIGDVTQQPFWIRLPGVLWGTFSVWGVLLLSFKLLDKKAAWAAGLMAAIFFFPVFYAREAHAYPMLWFCSAFSLYTYWKLLSAEPARLRDVITFGASVLGMVLCHLTGAMLLAAFCLVTVTLWLRERKSDKVKAHNLLQTGLACGVSVLAVAPFYIRVLTHNNPHLAEKSGVSPWFILHDVVSKLFLGDLVWLSVLAWITLLAGILSFALRRNRQRERRIALAILLITNILLVMASYRTQYLSARYFTPIAPLFYLFFAQGLYEIASFCLKPIRKEKYTSILFGILVVLLLSVHAFLFLLPLYKLEDKQFDFASIADWLNKNAAPGSPYIMESAYEMRFVPGYYKTPNLIPAAPYVHRAGAQEQLRLRERQRDFIERFPRTIYVETCHVGVYDWPEIGPWNWLHQHYKNRVQLKNTDLRTLIRLGIFPNYFRRDLNDTTFVTDIRYNTKQEIVAAARASENPILFDYEGWGCAQIAQGVYARMVASTMAMISVNNLSDQTLRGTFQLEGAIAEQNSYQITFSFAGKLLGTYAKLGGQMWSLQTPPVDVPPGTSFFNWGVSSRPANAETHLLLKNLKFVPAPTS